MKKLLVFLVMLIAMNANGQWVQMSNGPTEVVNSLVISGTNLFAGTLAGVFLSTNSGANWTEVNNGLTNLYINTLVVSGTTIFAGSINGIIFRTNDNGMTWTSRTLGSSINDVYALAVSGTNILAGTQGNGIFISTNNGNTWTAVNNGLTGFGLFVNSFTVSGSNIFTGTSDGLFLTTNNGTYWNKLYTGLPTNGNVHALIVSGTKIFAGIYGYPTPAGVYLSTNNGTTWKAVNNDLTDRNVITFAVADTNLFAGTRYGVYLSTNDGANWIPKSQGFPVWLVIHSLIISNNYIFAGVGPAVHPYPVYKVFRRSFSEIIGIQTISTETPSKYSLSQNYPNPFNPTTNIKFSIVSSQRGLGGDLVQLKVYNIQGREVRTLVNESLKPGTYEAAFDGSALNSGVYFYKLLTNGFSETKKMLLIK